MRTPQGLAASGWKMEGKLVILECTIPVGAQVRVILPASEAATVQEGGKSLAEVSDIQVLGIVENWLAVMLCSCKKRFTCICVK